MPVTPIYGLPYSALTDPPNGAAQQKALAEAVETELSTTNGDVTALDTKVSTFDLDSADFLEANPSAAGTWIDWGGTATFTNPNRAVKVTGWANMAFVNTAGTTDSFLRVGISFDNGSTWVFGPEIGDSHGTTWGARGNIFASENRAGTPTSTVVVKAQVFCNHTSTKAGPGQLSAILVPQ